jgi:hypothetical protein
MSVPQVNRIYMDREMEEVSLERMVFNACGKKEVEVKTAAIKPLTEIQFICLELNCEI